MLLNKLEIVEKGDFYHSVIALTIGMSLNGVFKNAYFFTCMLNFGLSSATLKRGEGRRRAREVLKIGVEYFKGVSLSPQSASSGPENGHAEDAYLQSS